jgi:ketosteroid isomerase-like protein
MSQAEIDTLRRFIDAAVRDDLAATLECLHPELELIPLRASTEGTFHGHEGWRRFREDTWALYERFEPEWELHDLGDGRVIGWGVIHVRGKGSGVEMEVSSAGIFEFRDGRILRWEDFVTKERALEMAGVQP